MATIDRPRMIRTSMCSTQLKSHGGARRVATSIGSSSCSSSPSPGAPAAGGAFGPVEIGGIAFGAFEATPVIAGTTGRGVDAPAFDGPTMVAFWGSEIGGADCDCAIPKFAGAEVPTGGGLALGHGASPAVASFPASDFAMPFPFSQCNRSERRATNWGNCTSAGKLRACFRVYSGGNGATTKSAGK